MNGGHAQAERERHRPLCDMGARSDDPSRAAQFSAASITRTHRESAATAGAQRDSAAELGETARLREGISERGGGSAHAWPTAAAERASSDGGSSDSDGCSCYGGSATSTSSNGGSSGGSVSDRSDRSSRRGGSERAMHGGQAFGSWDSDAPSPPPRVGFAPIPENDPMMGDGREEEGTMGLSGESRETPPLEGPLQSGVRTLDAVAREKLELTFRIANAQTGGNKKPITIFPYVATPFLPYVQT